MIQKHPYCRTCGSITQSKNVCNYCGCEPLKGNSYCCDCGTSTIAQAVMCVHCGASFQRKFPAVLAILLSVVVAATLVSITYFISQQGKDSSEKIADTINTGNKDDSSALYKIVGKKIESEKIIINNIPKKLLKNRNDGIMKMAKNLPVIPKPETKIVTQPATEISKPIMPKKIKEEIVSVPEDKTEIITGRVSMNSFSAGELRNYSVGCTYFEGRLKNNIVFFTTNVFGYIKIGGKIIALQGVQKGSDVARFAGSGYEVTIEIDGLAGNENAWLAAATMVVKDNKQRSFARHKIYSSCTEF